MVIKQEFDYIAEIENNQRIQIPAPEENHQKAVQIHTEIVNQINLLKIFKQYQDIDHGQKDHSAEIHFPEENRVVNRIKDQRSADRQPLLTGTVSEIEQLHDHYERQIVCGHVGQAEEAVAGIQDAGGKCQQCRQVCIVVPQQ